MLGLRKWPQLWTTFKFGCLFTGSEMSQQIILRKWNGSEEIFATLDWATIGRYAIWGFCVFPHVLRPWYRLLDAKFAGAYRKFS